jgi:hypothetical protein
VLWLSAAVVCQAGTLSKVTPPNSHEFYHIGILACEVRQGDTHSATPRCILAVAGHRDREQGPCAVVLWSKMQTSLRGIKSTGAVGKLRIAPRLGPCQCSSLLTLGDSVSSFVADTVLLVCAICVVAAAALQTFHNHRIGQLRPKAVASKARGGFSQPRCSVLLLCRSSCARQPSAEEGANTDNSNGDRNAGAVFCDR